jgi:hypothetical protein
MSIAPASAASIQHQQLHLDVKDAKDQKDCKVDFQFRTKVKEVLEQPRAQKQFMALPLQQRSSICSQIQEISKLEDLMKKLAKSGQELTEREIEFIKACEQLIERSDFVMEQLPLSLQTRLELMIELKNALQRQIAKENQEAHDEITREFDALSSPATTLSAQEKEDKLSEVILKMMGLMQQEKLLFSMQLEKCLALKKGFDGLQQQIIEVEKEGTEASIKIEKIEVAIPDLERGSTCVIL